MTEDYRIIPLTQGKFAKVSPQRFEELSRYRWCAHLNPSRNHFYAERGVRYGNKVIGIKMHRLILGLEKGDQREGDHINGDSLDNRDENLRIADDSQNAHNAKTRRDSRSGRKGVSWHKASGKWYARIKKDGKEISVGYFTNIEDAVIARGRVASQLHGEF